MRKSLSLSILSILTLGAAAASADVHVTTESFRLTAGDFREFRFAPGAPGRLAVDAQWKETGLGRLHGVTQVEVPLLAEILRPDGTVATQVDNGSPIHAAYSLSVTEHDRFRGRAWTVKIGHTVGDRDRQYGVAVDLRIEAPNSIVTLLDREIRDLAGDGAQVEIPVRLRNVEGRLEIRVDWRDGLADRALAIRLIRADGTVAKSVSGPSMQIFHYEVSAADLATGLDWKLRLQNNNRLGAGGIESRVRLFP